MDTYLKTKGISILVIFWCLRLLIAYGFFYNRLAPLWNKGIPTLKSRLANADENKANVENILRGLEWPCIVNLSCTSLKSKHTPSILLSWLSAVFAKPSIAIVREPELVLGFSCRFWSVHLQELPHQHYVCSDKKHRTYSGRNFELSAQWKQDHENRMNAYFYFYEMSW